MYRTLDTSDMPDQVGEVVHGIADALLTDVARGKLETWDAKREMVHRVMSNPRLTPIMHRPVVASLTVWMNSGGFEREADALRESLSRPGDLAAILDQLD